MDIDTVAPFKPFLEIYTLLDEGSRDNKQISLVKRLSYDIDTSEFVNVFSSLLISGGVSSLHVTFITHGFVSNIQRDKIPEMRNAILNAALHLNERNKQHFVVLVDWRIASKKFPWEYSYALKNIPIISKWLATFVTELRKEFKSSVYIHGIGHSLGAHLIGFCSKRASRMSNGCKPFDRITGLDPAGFSIDQNNPICLCKTDALMVDVIHTSPWLGRTDAVGTVDFYPNWGRNQPGCSLFGGIGLTNESHMRVLDLFLWSIENPGKFTTRKTFNISELQKSVPIAEGSGDEVEMGFYCKPLSKGIYYIQTKGQEPWI